MQLTSSRLSYTCLAMLLSSAVAISAPIRLTTTDPGIYTINVTRAPNTQFSNERLEMLIGNYIPASNSCDNMTAVTAESTNTLKSSLPNGRSYINTKIIQNIESSMNKSPRASPICVQLEAYVNGQKYSTRQVPMTWNKSNEAYQLIHSNNNTTNFNFR